MQPAIRWNIAVPTMPAITLRAMSGLAHRRLSIVDLSPGGRMPMSNETGDIWATFNGEIYNYRELRERLLSRGHQFRTQTDSETIIHAYEEWGTDCFNMLSGMFAIGIWDGPKRRMVLARDPHGKKPLYYFARPGLGLVFGSTLQPLAAWPWFPRRGRRPCRLSVLHRTGMCHRPIAFIAKRTKFHQGSFAVFDENSRGGGSRIGA